MPDHDNSSRTVTVPTCDHGPVAVWEPDWCTGSESEHQPGGYRDDITHASPDYEFTTSTSRGTAVILRACFEQRPFTERPPGHVPFVNVEMDGDWHPHSSDDLRRLSDTLTAHADGLRELADRLDGLANAFDARQRGTPAAANPEKSRDG
ncbi:hypothetical protein [Streptomyces sp. L2]|uniref:DUF6907 domain-containing protein n=1 Tax=Streptomyces sp. L2 TaxID=2162665 RepID=UPI00101116B9|nr:hypothetical protein [Streptomyces sp. L2]